MSGPEADPRFITPGGCREMAREMDRRAQSARLLVQRHDSWARALRSRAEKLEDAERAEAEAKALRFNADRATTNPQDDGLSPLESLFLGRR